MSNIDKVAEAITGLANAVAGLDFGTVQAAVSVEEGSRLYVGHDFEYQTPLATAISDFIEIEARKAAAMEKQAEALKSLSEVVQRNPDGSAWLNVGGSVRTFEGR